MPRCLAALLAAPMLVAGFALPLRAETATFIDGTYVFSLEACKKLKRLAAGGSQGVTSVPWYVTRDGISFWEGGCSFEKISKGTRKNEWHVVAACSEAADDFTETYTWRRVKPGRFSVTLTSPGTKPEDAKPKIYTRCNVGPIPEQQ